MYSSSLLRFIFGLNLAASLALSTVSNQQFHDPFPPISASLTSSTSHLSDFIGIAMGSRRLTADIAWVQTLLYYGTHEEGANPEEEIDSGGGHYPLLLSYCQRVVQIDPYFKAAIYYGAGALGWNLNRLDEAEQLLREGILLQPREWRFQQFLAAMAYQKSHNINKLVEFLEGFSKDKDCPNILRSILANLYKKEHRYRATIEIWGLVYGTNDPAYEERALSQIKELEPLARQELGPRTH